MSKSMRNAGFANNHFANQLCFSNEINRVISGAKTLNSVDLLFLSKVRNESLLEC